MPGFELIGNEEREMVNRIFDNGGILYRYGFNKLRNDIYMVRDFENEFAKRLGAKYAHAVTSGTTALVAGLKALGVGYGDEVITQSFTFVATAEAIIEVGAKPIFTEVNETLNMDTNDLQSRITERTKVILPVHMLGGPCDMDSIIKIAKDNNLYVIEDTAQALGGQYKERMLGTIGDIGTFSFDFGKALTTGEGGMVLTNNEELHCEAKEYADHGHKNLPDVPRNLDPRRRSGNNFRMMEIQGAIGIAQIKKLDFILNKQKELRTKLIEGLSDIPNITFRKNNDEKGDTNDSLVFMLKTAEQASIMEKKLSENGFGTKILQESYSWHFAGAWDHMLPVFEVYKNIDLVTHWKKSKDILSRSIALPIFVKMDDERISKLINLIKNITKDF